MHRKNTLYRPAFLSAVFCWLLTAPALPAQNPHGLLVEGDRHFDKKNYTKAENAYRKARGANGAYNAGNAAYMQGKYDAAVEMFSDASDMSLDPASKADALYNLGNALLQLGRNAEAIAAYEGSLRLLPNQPDAQKNLQIAKISPPPPNPPPPLPPPPPTPTPRPRSNYLDQTDPNARPEPRPAALTPEAARKLLEQTVLPEEEKNTRLYRELAPAVKPSKVKKDW